jgi:UDP-N-acetylmuramyl tripeptide synthase
MRTRAVLATYVCKITGYLSRKLGRGAGTNFPGKVALKIMPQLPEILATELDHGCVLVTGTNGKTTTSNMLAAIMRASGLRPIHNRSGANLITGITTALAQSTDRTGKPSGDVGLFEVDEATLPEAVLRLKPELVIITNLFRDQLDRYGELESLAAKMNKGLSKLEKGKVLLNADDPLVASLGEGTSLDLYFFGIGDSRISDINLRHAADSKNCRGCGEPLTYESIFLGHMGKYRCGHCGRARPKLHFRADDIHLQGIEGTQVTVWGQGDPLQMRISIPGLYNVYNALAAYGAARLLEIETQPILQGIEGYRTIFGRAERIEAEGRKIVLILSKNPAGFNEVIRTVTADGEMGKTLLLALNDRIADGRDVSWVWDVDFEDLARHAGQVVATGIRAEDMALRMKYAGVPVERIHIEKDLGKALKRALGLTPEGNILYALTTYTATLDLRRVMARLGYVKQYWEE